MSILLTATTTPCLLCHRSVDVHVPSHRLHMPLLWCPLYQAISQWQGEDAHLWMTIPYHSQGQAI